MFLWSPCSVCLLSLFARPVCVMPCEKESRKRLEVRYLTISFTSDSHLHRTTDICPSFGDLGTCTMGRILL
ncbi:hypothetical protein F5Y07DRAFT_374293 [Xylaria sp. FL0933]|nr:hypothetical protein F5Y07DRAFT_374293 [Xylaria sp. FL0933]